jgi:hypothetical protein
MFLTSQTFAPGTLGGLAGADAACNDLAHRAGLPGLFRAWLSTSGVDARSRLMTPLGTVANGWIRPDKRPFALSLDALLRGEILYPPRLPERGDEIVADTVLVATGTRKDGTRAPQTAGDWMSPSLDYWAGNAVSSGIDWTSGRMGATSLAHLYCFGIDYDRPPQFPKVVGRRAFLSRSPFTPSSLAAADALCQGDAASLQPAGTYHALLSMMSAGSLARFNLTGPRWVRLDGIPWLAATADLSRGNVMTALNLDTAGIYHDDFVWTGGSDPTSLDISNCNDWSTAADSVGATIGYDAYTNRYFFNAGSVPCSNPDAHVYCLEE